MKQQQQERANTNKIMETKIFAQQRSLASSEAMYKKLEGQYNILGQVREDLEVELEEDERRVQEVCHIRHSEQRLHDYLQHRWIRSRRPNISLTVTLSCLGFLCLSVSCGTCQ
jgi:hypothetical protein